MFNIISPLRINNYDYLIYIISILRNMILDEYLYYITHLYNN